MDRPIVKVEGLSHRYAVQWALRNIDLEIGETGIYGLLGSNGAGKSTLMNILCGVLTQTRGEVWINGVNTGENPVGAREFIGFLPQKPPLHGDLTVGEYLRYTAILRRMPGRAIGPAIDRVVEKCGIGDFRKRLLRNLSGGYQQRVGIAQAIIHDPSLVVLDEPTNGLDPNQIVEVRRLIGDIAQKRTVILSTHILSEVQAVCDHIYMVEQGGIVFRGTVEEFDGYIAPNALVAGFFEPPAMDELLVLDGIAGGEELSGGSFRLRYTDARKAMDAIVGASAAGGWGLREMWVEKPSMDSVFAALSKGGNPPHNPGKK